MFSTDIIDTDMFLDLQHDAQTLYFHLAMRADDDGFVSSPRRIQRLIGVDHESMEVLIKTGLIILFGSGVAVITHWKIHNYIQSDRYRETLYTEEKQRLSLNKNNVYILDT